VRTSGGKLRYDVTTRAVAGHPAVTLKPHQFSSSADGITTFNVNLETTGAPPGDYEGFIEITGGGQTYTIPYFVRVLDPALSKDVLLIDWDRNLGGVDYRPVYTAALDGLGLSYDVFDGGTATAGNAGPTYAQLQNYRSVVFFTGNNTTSWANAHVGGSFPLQDYLVAGGKIVFTGQDLNSQIVYNQNTGSDFLYATMGGWLTGATRTPTCTITASDRDFYGTGAANPTSAVLETAFTLLGKTGDVSTNSGGTGAGNQRFPDAGRTLRGSDATDLCVEAYNGPQVEPHARVLGSYTTTKKNGADVTRLTNAVATGVAPDPTLGQLTPRVSWSAAYLHVGLEGLNSNRAQLDVQTALGLLHGFVSDAVSVALNGKEKKRTVVFQARASSASGAAITKYRWDFGDGSPIVETTAPTVTHAYTAKGTYTAYVEAVNVLTRTNVASTAVQIKNP
jgi:hypothetical protein